ncbi:probable alpha-glucosidase [Hahella chejuensis KCTC 2396]|uniref:Probable alpha-glucosidase n=1 Tax=Hahella chejuensis (strain KCTC 2396) TaxID=349521 RepID=Q2SQF3_HAHCH|nr:alpha-glucosidase [Hahella chejuensis]ABC27121.1 probable alpha-glucosidase [Hahella chejuensis KCTC 2396]
MSKVERDWWRGCTIYQIYPRSYLDSNQDGIGDLPGIVSRLDYIAGLGVDAIWLSPFFTSPMKDFGYDVSDYRSVDPIFGDLDDFKRLVEKSHALGMKVMIDLVMSHTSDQHLWFQESSQDRTNPKADWYVWADPKPDGTPPNNWLAMFGGSAWAWCAKRRQYYMHNFLSSQPDLNYHNPEVQDQMLEEVRFWLDLGVDGFRLDTVNYYFHDKQLRDNPPLPKDAKKTLGAPEQNPYSLQLHVYDISRPDNIGFLKRLRELLDQYEGITTVGEIGADEPLKIMSDYTSGSDKLHMAYTFDLLNVFHEPTYIREVVERLENQIGDGWACWALSNHDVVRCVTRWANGRDRAPFAKLLLGLLLSLRGSACIYQGEELGLPEADVPYERLQDPYALPFWPEYKGRDGCRTPMVWESAKPYGGFSSIDPWLPVSEEHLGLAPDVQEKDPNSVLNFYRGFIHWRKRQSALKNGSIRMLDAPAGGLLFERCDEEQRIVIALNMTAETIRVPCRMANVEPMSGHGYSGELEGEDIVLPPYQAFFGELK